MCQSAITLISKGLNDIDNADVLLKIKGVIALFIQTMDVGSYARVGGHRRDTLLTASVHRAGTIQSLC